MPVCPGRVNGFSRKTKQKPFTLHGYMGHRIDGVTLYSNECTFVDCPSTEKLPAFKKFII